MLTFERRVTPRFSLCIPVRFRMEVSPEWELTAESKNISSQGVYVISRLPIPLGLPLQISLRMPKEVAGISPPQVRLTGRVVRVHPMGSPVREFGLAVQFDGYDAGWSANITEGRRTGRAA